MDKFEEMLGQQIDAMVDEEMEIREREKESYNQALEDFTSLLIDNLVDFGEGQNVIMAIDRGRIVRLKKQLVK